MTRGPHFDGAHVTVAFAEQMVMLAEACGGSLTEDRIRTYAMLLHDLTIDQVRTAVYRCARERDARYLPADKELRVPPVAELRQYVTGTEAEAGLVAWSRLQRAAEEIGAWASLEVEDPAIAAALVESCGSWEAFCALEDGPGLAVKRQEFLAAYRTARRSPSALGVQRLAGLCEGGNSQKVFAGRLTLGGQVLAVRDRPRLPGAPPAGLLKEGPGGR